jgi:hypothetical protein
MLEAAKRLHFSVNHPKYPNEAQKSLERLIFFIASFAQTTALMQ